MLSTTLRVRLSIVYGARRAGPARSTRARWHPPRFPDHASYGGKSEVFYAPLLARAMAINVVAVMRALVVWVAAHALTGQLQAHAAPVCAGDAFLQLELVTAGDRKRADEFLLPLGARLARSPAGRHMCREARAGRRPRRRLLAERWPRGWETLVFESYLHAIGGPAGRATY